MTTAGLEVYTAVYGGWDQPKPVHGLGVPAVLFTDSRRVAEAGEAAGWAPRLEPVVEQPTPMLRAKWWKCHPQHALPEAEASVWIDASITPLPGFVGRCGTALDGVEMALTPHPWRDCVYDELEASVGLEKYDAAAMRAQMESYRLAGHPPHWGLFASGALARRHTRIVEAVDDAWWAEIVHWSWQDQLSLPVVVRRDQRLRWAASMRWAEPWWAISPHAG